MTDLTTGAFAKKFKGESSAGWLSVSKRNSDAYIADELCGYPFTCNGYRNLFMLMKNTFDSRLYKAGNKSLPIYFIAGGNDPVIVSKKAWLDSQEFLRKVGYTDVRYSLYDGFRHEFAFEDDPTPFFEDIVRFIEE